jgi:hypothetical protein
MPGLTPRQALEKLTWEGAAPRYPEGVPGKVVAILTHELRLIEKLRYAGVVQKWPVLGNTDNRDPAARQGQF